MVIKGHKQDALRNISISLQSNNIFMDRYDLVRGFEILKLSNPDNNLTSPNPVRSQESAEEIRRNHHRSLELVAEEGE